MNVVAETTNDFYLGFDIINKLKGKEERNKQYIDLEENEENLNDNMDMTPEDLSRKCCLSFLEEIFYVNLKHKNYLKLLKNI